MHVVKIRRVGNSTGITLPRELIEGLHVAEGDSVVVTRSPDGLLVTPFDPGFAEAMEAFERTRRRFRNALRELAR